MLAALDVHLVGSDAWWHGLIAPVLAVLTAIAAAAIAAHTANRRQEVQLRHDRDLHYREETRGVVDKAATTATAASRACVLLEEGIRGGEGDLAAAKAFNADPTSKDLEEAEEIVNKATARNHEVLDALTSTTKRNEELASEMVRLSLRMGFKAPAVNAYRRYQEAFKARHDYVNEYREFGLKEADSEELEGLKKAQQAALAAFFSECDVWYEEGREGPERPSPWWKFWQRRRSAAEETPA